MDDPIETWTIAINADSSQLRRELGAAQGYGERFGRSLTRAFEGVALHGKGLGDTLKGLALNLSRLTLSAALRPLEQGIGSLVQGLFSGAVGGGARAALAPALPIPFAKGGVIASPVAFPLERGRTGLAGERGPEAILPLARGTDGRLGVAAAGAGGGVSIVFNVTTPDAESFRRSQTQIAAQLARAIGAGERNL